MCRFILKNYYIAVGDNIGNESIYSNIGSCPINEIPTGLGNKNDTIRTENVLKKATELLNNIPQNGCDVLDGCQVFSCYLN
jgi:hypothetical protein